MIPGHSVAAVLVVNNAGSVPFSYTATSAATNPDGKNLAAALQVKVTAATSVSGSSPTATCADPALADTASTLNGGLVRAARTIVAGGSERLCLQVSLPTTAPNAVQSATTGITFAFTAVQVGP